MIWVATSEAVTTIDDKNGWTRPAASRIVGDLSQLVLTADGAALDAVTRLTHSRFSPHKIGATFLYSLSEAHRTTFQSAGISIAELGLNVTRREDWPTIEHELKHTDGAAVIDLHGRVLRKAVMLETSQQAQRIKTDGGMRHHSAVRHTFDRPDLLAFVVSSDGPVSI